MDFQVEPRKMGNYTIPEAAKYICAPYSTILRWVTGRKTKHPIFEISSQKKNTLSFLHLTQLHLLNTIRKNYKITPKSIYTAIQYLKRYATNEDERMYPLASRKIFVDEDRREIFVKELGAVISASKSGQATMHDLLGLAIHRIKLDDYGLPIKLYPFTRPEVKECSPRNIEIDPKISFGRPVISGTGIPISIVAERFQCGESEKRLSRDYGCSVGAIQEAIRVELYSNRQS